MNIFPWDNKEPPYWVNPENGLEWYFDKTTTDWCFRETLNNSPKLNAICFYVCKRTGDKVEPISRVLLDKKTNEILADETLLEAMAVKIDLFRLSASYDKKS